MDYKTLYEQSQKEVARMKCWARIHENNIDNCLADVYQKDMEIERLTEEVKTLKEENLKLKEFDRSMNQPLRHFLEEKIEGLEKDKKKYCEIIETQQAKFDYQASTGFIWEDKFPEFLLYIRGEYDKDTYQMMFKHLNLTPIQIENVEKKFQENEKKFQESVARTEAIACDPDAPFGHA